MFGSSPRVDAQPVHQFIRCADVRFPRRPRSTSFARFSRRMVSAS